MLIDDIFILLILTVLVLTVLALNIAISFKEFFNIEKTNKLDIFEDIVLTELALTELALIVLV